MAYKRNLKSRKRSKKELPELVAIARDLQLKLIGVRLTLDEVPDMYLPQAPLCRATLDLISDCFRKWIVRMEKDLAEYEAEQEAIKEEKRKKRVARKKVTARTKKQG